MQQSQLEVLGEEHLEAIILGVSEILLNKSKSELIKIRETFLQEETRNKEENNKELPLSIIEEICTALSIPEENRLSFNQAENFISNEYNSGDAANLYMIDLSEGENRPERGLDILEVLINLNSNSTAFLLTHNADIANERDLENDFFSRPKINKKIAFSVIAKEKFSQQIDINSSLKLALKRVTLRKNLIKVLENASNKIQESYALAQNDLLDITPEQLEKHVISKSLGEGVSELHILERSITSYLSYEIKKYFINDPIIHENIKQIRKLKNIPIENPHKRINDNLIKFRSYEIWEEGDFINSSYMPIFCGDVFEYISGEQRELFILIGQPCDILIRDSGKRRLRTGFFLPIKVIDELELINKEEYCSKNDLAPVEGEDVVNILIDKCVELENYKIKNENLPTLKNKYLNYYIDSNKYSCSFSNYFSVNLNLLDCCSFNEDGKVFMSSSHEVLPDYILPGITKCHGKFLRKIKQITDMSDIFKKENIGLFNLSIDIPGSLKINPIPMFSSSGGGVELNWNLKRIGRIKSPYSTDLLKSFMDVYSRNAFDMEYIDE
ncbi:MAG: hypothetical protein L0G39_20365 [Chryseobacterium sp.]|nr:hypothetical protein [Chryseobacterium sp.]MDN5649863.1 hypothetical protein [Acinetobacter sp.]